jgi:tetratricopeptide (TPR) repeat protein
LRNDPQQAAAYLERATGNPDVASDRALLQRAAGQLSDALITLDGVLETSPHHAQAQWNRALVLRDLGLALSAARQFDAVAALNEPGWADEARANARALSAQVRDRQAAFLSIGLDAVSSGMVAPDVARRFPGRARVYLYEAVRTAPSADAVRALAPLAHTLDAVYSGHVLGDYVERIARSDFARRAPLARRYAGLAGGQRLDPADGRALLAVLRAAQSTTS